MGMGVGMGGEWNGREGLATRERDRVRGGGGEGHHGGGTGEDREMGPR
jgi:hypothetical protein